MLELFFAIAGLERSDSRFVCLLACDSFETGFLDGMGGGGGGGGYSIHCPSIEKE